MLMLLLFFITVILCLVLFFLKLFSKHKDHPPGPSSISLLKRMLLERSILSEKTLMELAQQYGKIYSLWQGNNHIVVFSGYKIVKEALIDHSDDFVDRPFTHFLVTICKKQGIAFSNGHTWLQQRQVSVVTMRKLGLGKKGLESLIQTEVERFLEDLRRKQGQPFDPSLDIQLSVCNVICALSFGHCFSIEDKEFLEMLESMHTLTKYLVSFSHIIYGFFPFIMKYLPGSHQKTLSAVENIIGTIKKEIAQHKENQNLHEPQDFIDYYLLQMEKSKDDPNSTYDEDNLAHCIADLLIGGTDSTSGSLQWALLLMATHLDVQDKVHKELEEVLASSRSINYGDRKNLPYTNAVIHEIIRSKYVSLFGIPRQCTKDIYLNGFLIPKGAVVFPDLRSVLLDSEQWETPEQFNPNHFLDKEGHFVTKEAFLPFGAGARICLGELFARIEFFITFTSLLRVFRIQPPEGVEKLSDEPIVGITIYPSPFKICFVPRSSTSQ